MTFWELFCLWAFRGIIAVASTILLFQIAEGWYGWGVNIKGLIAIVVAAFGLGMIEWENRENP